VQVVWYTAMSIDGRIAGPGDDMSFLDTVAGEGRARLRRLHRGHRRARVRERDAVDP
jgi:hypothetical protein